jgi:hypothetical protein
MPNILTHDPVRDLPIYRDGFTAGQNVGLRVALEVLVAAGTIGPGPDGSGSSWYARSGRDSSSPEMAADPKPQARRTTPYGWPRHPETPTQAFGTVTGRWRSPPGRRL